MKIILEAAQLFKVVSGELRKPVRGEEGDGNFEHNLKEWETKEIQAKMMISTSVGDQPLSYIMGCETSEDMWKKLNGIYEQNSKFQIHLLQQRFYAYNKMETHDMPQILVTLPSAYNHFHSAWESTSEENKTLEHLSNRLIMEETRLKLQQNQSSKPSFNREYKRIVDSQNRKCYNCGKFGHISRDCKGKEGIENKNVLLSWVLAILLMTIIGT